MNHKKYNNKDYIQYEDLKKCRRCGRYIDIMATECEYCGEQYDVMGDIKKVFIFVIVAGIIVGLLSLIPYADIYHKYFGKEETVNITTATTYRLNEPFISEDEKVIMTEVNTDFKDYPEYRKPEEGYKFVMAKFEIENINKQDEEMVVNSFNFKAYADHVLADHIFWESETYEEISADLMNGEKTVGYVFYTVPVDTETMTISYSTIARHDKKDIEFVVAE